MQKLTFINPGGESPKQSSCCPPSTGSSGSSTADTSSCCPQPTESSALKPSYALDMYESVNGPVPRVSTVLSPSDKWGAFRSRTGAYRMRYEVRPGLHAVGEPSSDSDVFVSANYKLSFDRLRCSLSGLSAWILVLDTNSINVWCAAGKGTFGTQELIKQIQKAKLEHLVSHRRIIVPQLGAPGIRAHEVKRATGFHVKYGPVRAEDLPRYLRDGYQADVEMRTVTFPLMERLVLTPMELNPALRKLWPLVAAMLLFFGLRPEGILYADAWSGGGPFIALLLTAIMSGAFLTPVLLPWVPFRSFALKGLLMGALTQGIALLALKGHPALSTQYLAAAWVFFPALSSYIALQFTGSTTYTGMSGVERELRIGLPLYLLAMVLSIGFIIADKITHWSVS